MIGSFELNAAMIFHLEGVQYFNAYNDLGEAIRMLIRKIAPQQKQTPAASYSEPAPVRKQPGTKVKVTSVKRSRHLCPGCGSNNVTRSVIPFSSLYSGQPFAEKVKLVLSLLFLLALYSLLFALPVSILGGILLDFKFVVEILFGILVVLGPGVLWYIFCYYYHCQNCGQKFRPSK